MNICVLLSRKRRLGLVVGAVALGLLSGAGQFALGDPRELGLMHNSSVIENSALSGVKGVSTTNMAAGDGNLQSNSGVLAIGNTASSANTLMQHSRIGQGIANREEIIGIKDHAFQQSQGWLSVNQAAGQGNVQSNSFGVALGISVSSLSNTALQQVMADQQGLQGGGDDSSKGANRRIEVDKTSFEGVRGVIQVNQSAGMGNATRNSFQMNMALGE